MSTGTTRTWSRDSLAETITTSPPRPTVLPTPTQTQHIQLAATPVSQCPDSNAEDGVIASATTCAERLLSGSRVISNSTRIAAAVLKEQADWGHRELANGSLDNAQRAIRFIQCAHTRLESYLALKETNARLAASHATAVEERNQLQRQLYQLNHVAAIDAYADYVGRLLRAVRNRVQTAVRNKQISPKIAKAGFPHADFLDRDWAGIAVRLRKEAVAIAKWAVDTSVDKGARPKPDMLTYLSDLSWQYGQDFNERLRVETLAWMVKTYGDRCEEASKFKPLVKMKDWVGLHNLIESARGAVLTAFSRPADRMVMEALSCATSFCQQWYFCRPTRRNNNQRHLPTRHATDEADRLSSRGGWSSSTLDGDKNDDQDEDENDGEEGRRQTMTDDVAEGG
ncbi:hypothetical protein GCG54_00012853 [Colletotrichum gloeosporioides]|uniref:Uncharacterized protein n=1 Tax=Colletotrichum gloeosporioides TaxID=474922 RepID=A0A8H4FPA2_COLGL|nr:uncharacterized protein GCG54_00012853 [Colletotrichum gloeosporioides]KAF3809568.1 hypothetical protein GCG54_00012853 [Colletotrichum gloeosporioides]